MTWCSEIGPSSVLNIELARRTKGLEHDSIDASGVIWLDGGDLVVTLIDGFVPLPGDHFAILNGAGISGDFGQITLPTLPSGSYWDTRYLNSGGSLRVAVQPATYAQWRAAFSLPAGSTDFDNDGSDDALEYLLASDPTSPDPDGTPVIVVGEIGGETHVGIEFSVPHPAASDVRYFVEASSQLGTWDIIATKVGDGEWSGTGSLFSGAALGGRQSVKVFDDAFPDGDLRGFLRLRGEVTEP